MLKKQHSLFLTGAKIADLVLILLSAYGAFYIKFDQFDAIPGFYHSGILIGSCLVLIVASAFGIYRPFRGRSLAYLAPRLMLAWLVWALVMTLIAFFTKTGAHFSREWMAMWLIYSFIVVLLCKLILISSLRWFRKRGLNQRHIMIIGAGDLGQKLLNTTSDQAWMGYNVKVLCDDDPSHYQGQKFANLTITKTPEDLEAFIMQEGLDEVWIALPLFAAERIKEIIHALRFSPLNLRLFPDVFAVDLVNHSVSDVAGMPVLNLRSTPMVGFSRLVKSIEDKVISFIILCLISPILLVLAIAVKLSSPGPVFYRQERVSWNGKKFGMLKFRSMPVDAEKKSGAVWATKGEQRATKIGGFMRKTSLDELPQFINVLKGDMSIVGPRPERPVFVDKFKHEIPGYMQKHMVKAGITGWAQINGWRGDTDLQKRIEYDLYYIENWSLLFDLKIIWLTVFKGFVNSNAY